MYVITKKCDDACLGDIVYVNSPCCPKRCGWYHVSGNTDLTHGKYIDIRPLSLLQRISMIL